uniref:Uncharacterized protein n=1 Tax=Rhizophora mucronata TaxID=61149 RepID=A0A2P2QGY0_RHIMU
MEVESCDLFVYGNKPKTEKTFVHCQASWSSKLCKQ